jgi:hypothetical protein
MAETKSLLFFCNLGISFTEMQTGCLGTAGGQRPSRARAGCVGRTGPAVLALGVGFDVRTPASGTDLEPGLLVLTLFASTWTKN